MVKQETLADRLNQRLRELGLRQRDVAQGVGLSDASIHQWFTGASKPSAENLVAVANFLKCSPEWLVNGGPLNLVLKNTFPLADVTSFRVPMLSWSELPEALNMMHEIHQKTSDWHVVPFTVGPRSFALKVTGEAMVGPPGVTSIPPGAIVTVDPDADPQNEDIVALKVGNADEGIVRRYVVEGADVLLEPANPRYETKPLDRSHVIVGVVRASQQIFR